MSRLQLEPWLPKYAKPLRDPHRYKVLYGGRGGARSWTVARQLLVNASRTKLRVLCTRELQRSIRGSVHQLLRDQITLLGIPGYTVTDTEIRHVRGSLFIFLGLRHNVNEIKSLEGVDICWVEEAEAVPHASWEALIPTVRKPGSEIWVTFNPDLETDSTYRRFVLHRPPGAWVKKVSYRDNKWLPAELEAERLYLRKADRDAYDHVWNGECRKSSAAQVLHGKWVEDDLEPAEGWTGPYYGVDFGFATDPFALVECWIEANTLHIQRELYRVGLDLDRTARACQLAAPGCAAYVIRADNARPESISYLKKPHDDPGDHAPYALPRIEAVEKWQGSIEDGIGYLRAFERIVVHSRCKHWIAEAKAYSYKVDERSGDILPVIQDKDNNLIDATRYALAPMIRHRESAFTVPPAEPTSELQPLFLTEQVTAALAKARRGA